MMRRVRLVTLMLAMLAPGAVAAQGPHPAAPAATSGPVQNMFSGQNQDQPIQIEAATLEVRDKSKIATFSGDVQVVQGDTTIKCPTLGIFYGPEEGASAGKPPPAHEARNQATPAGMPQNAQNIRRIEARGGVTVISKDQTASGDLGVYDLKTKLITLSGNVVVSQGKNVM